mgnify:FL=1
MVQWIWNTKRISLWVFVSSSRNQEIKRWMLIEQEKNALFIMGDWFCFEWISIRYRLSSSSSYRWQHNPIYSLGFHYNKYDDHNDDDEQSVNVAKQIADTIDMIVNVDCLNNDVEWLFSPSLFSRLSLGR